MMLPPGAPAPAEAPNTTAWTARTDLFGGDAGAGGVLKRRTLRDQSPCLVLTGGRSHPRFAQVATRLQQVLPKGRTSDFPSGSHLSPPMREEPANVAELLREPWESASR
jgi:hypothetical protein